MTKEYIYGLKYEILVDDNDHKGYQKSMILKLAEENEYVGACDSLLFFSILKPRDGGFSIYHHSYDGMNEMKPISSIELFKVWALLANKLKDDPELRQWHRDIAEIAHEQVFASVERIRSGDDVPPIAK